MIARRSVFLAAALALLGVTGLLLYAHRAAPDTPLIRQFDTLPGVLDGWSEAASISADVLPTDLRTPRSLVRAYRKGATTLSVSVGYYSMRPPPPELFLPSRGWSSLEQRVVVIPLDERPEHSLTANLLIAQTGDRRTAILYWFQIGPRPFASEHRYRAALLWNRFMHGRAESALVRIVSPLDRSADPATILALQGEFVRLFYPELVKTLPG